MNLTIKYDNKIKIVDRDSFVMASRRMLSDFGLESTLAGIDEQIDNILAGRELNVVGVFLEDYIVVSARLEEQKSGSQVGQAADSIK
jgi:hypothetical protein